VRELRRLSCLTCRQSLSGLSSTDVGSGQWRATKITGRGKKKEEMKSTERRKRQPQREKFRKVNKQNGCIY
jgi:hypothetical protein